MLQINDLLPTPLAERLDNRPSQVWMQRLHVAPGERVFVQAPSGTGKTTLLHVLYGLRADYSGTVHWNGQPLAGMDAETVAALRAGPVSVVFQDLRIFPELTAWENLTLKMALNREPAATPEEALEWMNRLGIAGRKDKPGRTLSYGEQQRLAIIRALVQPFQYLLMDEPFSHLDAANTQLAAGLIQEVCDRRGAAFLLADLDDNDYFPYTRKLTL